MSKDKHVLFEQLHAKVLADIAEKEKQLNEGEYVPVVVEWEEECVVDEIVSEFNLKGYTVTHSYSYLGDPKDGYHWLEIEKV